LAAAFLLFFTLSANAQTASSFRLATYNLLKYDNGDTAFKNPELRKIFPQINADIVVTVEMMSQSAAVGLQNRVLNANSVQYSMAQYFDGPDTDPALYFKSSKFQFISAQVIPTALRNVVAYTLRYIPSGDTLRVLAVHLKASLGEEALRAAEVDSIRKYTNTLRAGSNFIICGDFNIYTANEAAYQKLLAVTSGNEGHFFDPLNLPGTWNQSGYALYHTQSTRLNIFGNGSTGGMDDRFDMVLYSKALKDSSGLSYLSGSFKAYGNDGNHYNASINSPANTVVSQSIADALYNASDHLPVYADFKLNTPPTASILDAQALQLLTPVLSTCSVNNKSIGVRVKNNSTDTIKFSQQNLNLAVQLLTPSSLIENYTAFIGTGTLAPGATLDVSVLNNYNFIPNSTYQARGWIRLQGDTLLTNDTLALVPLVVPASFTVDVSPVNPIVCSGASTVLTASTATTWLWSTGATTQSITVNSTGTYTVTATDNTGCSKTASSQVNVLSNPTTIVFSENMGIVSGNTFIATHESANGFENDALTMTGSGDVRITTTSTGYATASGGANIFLTNTSAGRNFIISNINTMGLVQLTLSFGIWKSTTGGTGSDLEVSYSTDGVTFTPLAFPPLTSGASWSYRTANEQLPTASNLRIQFKNLQTITQFRIDDVLLKGTPIPQIQHNNQFSFCTGDSLLLTTSTGQQYLWSTGETTASIYAKTAGNYTVSIDCIQSDTLTLATTNCTVSTLTIKAFLQGYYTGANQMTAVLYNAALHADPMATDSIELRLHASASPYNLLLSQYTTLKTNGTASINFPPVLNGQLVYIAIRHRSSLEAWSKTPVLLNTNCSFYFTP
jgi:endonuclease/exonuclease/phosphatase family metal-dependent hydrolase